MDIYEYILDKKEISLILLIFIILTIFMSIIIPPFEAPDEPGHLEYINFLANNFRLPNQYKYFIGSEGHQPPLYYFLLSIILRLIDSNNQINLNINENNRDLLNFHIIRIIQIIFSIITILFSYKILLLISDNNYYLANIGTFFIITLPQFVFISAVINNDNLANMLSTISIFHLFRMFKNYRNIKDYIYFSIFLGFSLITKLTSLFLFIPFLFIFLIKIFEEKNRITIFKYFSISIVIIFIISGWYFLYNKFIYGDFFSLKVQFDTLPFLVSKKTIFSNYFLNGIFTKTLFYSFVGVFGWMNIWLPKYIINIYFYIFLFSIACYIIIKKYRNNIFVSISFIIIISILVEIIFYNLKFSQPQGRFLFPAISNITFLIWYPIIDIIKKINQNLKLIRFKEIIFYIFLVFFFYSIIYSINLLINYY